jgi:Family of unknown function (DUF6113)
MRRVRGLLGIAGLVAAGAIVGIVGAFVQAITLSIGGLRLPVGAVVAVVMVTAAVRSAAVFARGRAGAVAVAAGWAATVLWMTLFPTDEGDVIIAATTSGAVYVYGGVLLAAFAVVLPASSLRSSRSESLR